MSDIIVYGRKNLNGKVKIHGSKNSVLPVMAAALLNEGITEIENWPDLSDVDYMKKILIFLGCQVYFKDGNMFIDSSKAVNRPIEKKYTSSIRASSILMGAVLSRFGKVKIAFPGGCSIGSRPLDIHLEGFKRLGASWEISDEYIEVNAVKLVGNDINMKFPSVGATENIIMASVMAQSETVIKNAAKEPEITQLCDYLRKAGAKISGDGTEIIKIEGVRKLQSVKYVAPSDRIVAGTYLSALAVCQGRIILENCSYSVLRGFLDVFTGMGMEFSQDDNKIIALMRKKAENINYIRTSPYPGFPTDMQSMIISVASTGNGTMIMQEKIFENRFHIVKWLKNMGADIKREDDKVIVCGKDKIKGCDVYGDDLRGSAALVIAGLSASGMTTVHNAEHILRGYEGFCDNLNKLGAEIKWLKN